MHVLSAVMNPEAISLLRHREKLTRIYHFSTEQRFSNLKQQKKDTPRFQAMLLASEKCALSKHEHLALEFLKHRFQKGTLFSLHRGMIEDAPSPGAEVSAIVPVEDAPSSDLVQGVAELVRSQFGSGVRIVWGDASTGFDPVYLSHVFLMVVKTI